MQGECTGKSGKRTKELVVFKEYNVCLGVPFQALLPLLLGEGWGEVAKAFPSNPLTQPQLFKGLP